MKSKQLFIIGSGRSGTTLVQRVLNTLPETMIWGEHAGFLTQLADQYYFLKENNSMKQYSYDKTEADEPGEIISSIKYKDPKIWQAWINWFKPEDLKSIFRKNIESFFCPEKFNDINIWGFKEIRYGRDDRVIEFLSEIYPESRFLFIIRESLNNIESQVTTFHMGESRIMFVKRLLQLPTIIRIARSWYRQNSYLHYLNKKDPEHYYLLRYEDIIEDLSLLDPFLQNYDLEIAETQRQILSMKEGRGTQFNQSSSVHLRWKRLGLIPSLISEIIVGHTSKKLGYERPKTLIISTMISSIFHKLFHK